MRRFETGVLRRFRIGLLILCFSVLFAGVATQAAALSVVVPLTGGQEEPEPVFTGAFGTALLDFDPATDVISVNVQVFGIDVADLLDIPNAGPFHLHIETPDPPTDQVGPIAITFGTAANWTQHQNGITLSIIGVNNGNFTAQQVEDALFAGKTYLNLHTLSYNSGEIRGDVPALVPEPGTALLLSLGLLGLGSRRRLH